MPPVLPPRISSAEVVAERIYEFHSPEGNVEPVRVVVGQPQQIDDDEWNCKVAIEFPESAHELAESYDIHGIDALQALVLGMRMLELRVENLLIQHGDRITLWGDPALPF